MTSTPDQDNPLDLYSSVELVDELARRSDGLVLLTMESLTPDEEGFNMWFRGGRIVALGLLERAKFGLLNKQDSE